MPKRPCIFLLLFGLSSQGAHVHGQEAIARLTSQPFHEEYTKEAPVSGRVIAGIGLSGSALSSHIALQPPDFASGNTVCVRVMSRDGLYWSKNTFELPSAIDTNPIPLEYPSKYINVIQTYKPDDLAVLAYIGDCKITDNGPLIISTRFSGVDTPNKLQIYINSARSDTSAIIANQSSGPFTTRCSQILEGRRTGYDTICTIDLSELDQSLDHLDIKIKRRQHDRILPATELRVELPKL